MEKIKIILLGNSGVGKTAFLHRFKTGKFDETLPQTTSVEFLSKRIQVDDKEIEVTIWDTVGQERFNSLATSYFRKVEGVLLLYDVTDMNSFLAVSDWIRIMRKHDENSPILIVGNKNEEAGPRRKAVNISVVHEFVREGNFDNIEISVKTGDKVKEAFLCLIRKALMAKQAATAKDGVIKLTRGATTQTESSSCFC